MSTYAQRKRKRNLFLGAVAAIVLLIGLLIYFLLKPSFSLVGSKTTVEAGSTVTLTDYIKKTHRMDRKKIKISGKVDAGTVGDYPVTYSYGKQKKKLTVQVTDTVKPVLTAKENLSVRSGGELTGDLFVDVKDATACTYQLDAGKEDLTQPGKHPVTVTVTDGGGNTASLKLEVEILDPDVTPPTVSGLQKLTVTLGTKVDLKKGVTVSDENDPAPTLEIQEGSLNTEKAGTYIVQYTATDRAGNRATYKRTVIVVNSSQKTDDGKPQGGSFAWDVKGVSGQPYLVAVNRACCTVTVYGKDGDGNYTVPKKAFACSVGRAGHETPTGRFNTHTKDRYEWHLMVDNSYGRYAIRINGGIMFHSVCYHSVNKTDLEYEEYNKLGSPASLGCVRLCVADIKWIYDNCPPGFPTVIYDDAATAGPLGKPTPKKIDINDTVRRGWDPTDWDEANPWKNQ